MTTVLLVSQFVFLLCFAPFVSLVGATTYVSPSTPPTFSLSYSTSTKLIHAQVGLTYYTSENIQYTHLFGFAPWDSELNVFSDANCTNRRRQDFNPNNPPLWTELWAKQAELNETAISGSYLSWPTPSLPWTVSIGSLTKVTADESTGRLASSGVVKYDADFTIETLANCAGSSLLSLTTEDKFIYGGTFYVVWIQPVQAYLPIYGSGLGGVYSTKSYEFPFVIKINRHVDTVDEDPKMPSFVYSFILDFQWVIVDRSLNSDGEMVYTYRLHLLLETKTPASLYSDGTVANYNDLSPLTTILLSTSSSSSSSGAGFALTLNQTDVQSQPECVVLTGSTCRQRWSYYSDPLVFAQNVSIDLNDTYYFTATLQKCYYHNDTNLTSLAEMDSPLSPSWSYSTSIRPNVCTNTALVTNIKISVDLFLGGTDVINVVDQFSSNLTYYEDETLTAEHVGTTYLPGQDVIVKHWADLYPLSPDYYTLVVQNVYVCAIVDGGHAPYLGYDSLLGMWRKGCSVEEYIDGTINIRSDSILVVALNNTQVCCEYQNLNNSAVFALPKSQDVISFSLDAMVGMTDFYVHIESILLHSFDTQSKTYWFSQYYRSPHTNDVPTITCVGGGKLYDFGGLSHFTMIRDDGASSKTIAATSINVAAVVGGSVGGGVLLVSAIVWLVVYLIKRRNKERETGIGAADKRLATAAAIVSEGRWEAISQIS